MARTECLRLAFPFQMYISKDNVDANEYDFIKALELLDFVEVSSRAEMLRLRIWCQAILRDQ